MILSEAAALITERLPDVQAVYVFGSAATGHTHAESDLDLAVLSTRPLAARVRWEVQEALAEHVRGDVDLVDLRAASDVLRVQVLAQGRVVLDRDAAARQQFEAYALSSYALLNEERQGILADVQQRGSVYG